MATEKTKGKNSINKFGIEVEYTEYARDLYETMYGVFMTDKAEDQKMLKLVSAKNKPDDIMEKYIASVGELVGTQKTLKADAFRNIYFSALRTYYEWKQHRDLEELTKTPSNINDPIDIEKISRALVEQTLKEALNSTPGVLTPSVADRIKALVENNKTTHVAKKDTKTNTYSFKPKEK